MRNECSGVDFRSRIISVVSTNIERNDILTSGETPNKNRTLGKTMLIESEGLLYRGPAADCPVDVWDYPRKRWVPYASAGPQEKGWGKKITARRAARLKKNNPAAEHFMYYDTPPWLQPPNPELAAEAFQNKDAEQTLDTVVANTGGFEQMSAVKEIVETGEIGERTLNALATQLQVEPAKLQEGFAPVLAEFERQGRAVFSQGGLDADEVIAFAQQHQRDALNIAMHKHATQRTTAGYAAIRTAFLASLGETNPERALAADLGPGISTFLDPKRGVMVRIPGYGDAMPWRSAIQAFGPK